MWQVFAILARRNLVFGSGGFVDYHHQTGLPRSCSRWATEGKSVVLVLEASLDNEGGYDCSVNLAPEIPVGAEVEEIEGVKVGFLRRSPGGVRGGRSWVDP